MSALSPLFPECEWPLDDPISHESLEDLLHFSPITDLPRGPRPIQLDHSLSFTGGRTIVKKLDHNAGERDRRKKINTLYSSLRSLLPLSEQKKRLSIPATVSRMLTYITELQAEVDRLGQKKQEILSRIMTRQDEQNKSKDRLTCSTGPPPAISFSATRISERDIAVQISAFQAFDQTYPLSQILSDLEENGLLVTDASCFQSFGGRVFCNLHFQVEETRHLEGAVLNEKLVSLFGKRK